jgi:tetratricopeptide (TPR) repeat protein
MVNPVIGPTPAEYIADALAEVILALLPPSTGAGAGATLGILRQKLQAWLKQDRIRRQLLEAARRGENDFRARARVELDDDSLIQAVASFPLFDRELFQASLQTLPGHLSEDYLADQLAAYIDDDWKGMFTPPELRQAVALYLSCLRVRLLRVEGYAELVTQLAVLRSDERTGQILNSTRKLERMVQVLLERADSEGAAARSSRTIPEPVADFVGRSASLGQLKDDLANGARSVEISGMGGVGKTELARKLAQEIGAAYPDGSLAIELLGTSAAALPWQQAMRKLLLPYIPGERLPQDEAQLRALYQETFARKKALLLLDDAANPEQVRPLVPAPPSAAIITSRLHFSLAEFGMQRPVRLGVLSVEESSELLLSTSSQLATATPTQIAEIARLCGWLPLALRIAGSLTNDRDGWDASTLLERLDNEATRLSRLSRTGDSQLNVEAVLSLSYELLPDEMKVRFRLLAVFTAWIWPLIAAGVWGIGNTDESQEYLDDLAGRNLLAKVRAPGIDIRTQKPVDVDVFAMHDLTRLFAAKIIAERPEEAAGAVERHAQVFVELATYCDWLYAQGGELREQGLGLFQGALQELEVALTRLEGSDKLWPRPPGADELLKGIPTKIQNLLQVAIPPPLAIRVYEGALESTRRQGKHVEQEAENSPPSDEVLVPVETALLINLADAYSNAGQPDLALERLESARAALDTWKAVSPRGAMLATAKLLGNMGSALFQRGRLEEALQKFTESLELARSCDLITESTALGNIGNIHAERGEDALAIDYYEDQAALARRIGFERDEALALSNMATVFSRLGEHLAAAHLRMRAISIARKMGDLRNVGKFHSDLSVSLMELGDGVAAVQAAEHGLGCLRSSGFRMIEGHCLVNLGSSYAQVGRSADAVEAWTEGERVLKEVGFPNAQLADMHLPESIKRVQAHPGEERTPRTMVARVIAAHRQGSPQASSMFDDMQAISRDPAAPEEVGATAKVLYQILAGNRNPDLESLPYSIAQAVVYHLQKPVVPQLEAVG